MALWRPTSTTFLLGAVGGFGVRARCCRFQQLSSMHPRPRNLHLSGNGLAPVSRGPRPGAIGRDLGLTTRPWLSPRDQSLGPAPGDPELLSAFNADSHSARASDEADPDFPEEAWVPVNTDPGPPETFTTEWTVCTIMSEETQVRSVWQTTDLTNFSLLTTSANDTAAVKPFEGNVASTDCLASGKEMRFSTRMRLTSFSVFQTG